MRVSRAQADENREKVINVASRLFRKHGFDGIGLKEVMKQAGLTQGAFYKQFKSKEDLIAQSSKRGLDGSAQRWSRAVGKKPDDPIGAVLDFYLSKDHCGAMDEGCPIAALGADAARQGDDVKIAFEAGVNEHLAMLSEVIGSAKTKKSRAAAMAALSAMVGAVLISRAVNDETLAKGFLESGSQAVRAILR